MNSHVSNIVKRILILLVFITFTSCHLPKYTHSGNVNSRLDLNSGKWLLGKIESPKGIENTLMKISNKEFSKLLGDRFSNMSELKGLLAPNNIPNNPSKAILKDIRNGTGFDYFIMIGAISSKDEIGDLQIGKIYSPVQNSVEINIDIYDLNLLEKFYSQKVIGSLSIQEDNQDFAFAKGTNNMIITGFNKIMRKIKKNRIKNVKP